MKILHVITGLAEAAGTSTFCGEVCNQLAALGHDVTIAVCNPKATNIYPLDSRVHLVSIASILSSPPAFSTFSLVHLHALWTPILHKVSQWAHKQGIPVIWSTHGMTAPWSLHHKWWKKCLPWYLYQRRDLARAQLIHCTSDFEVEWNQKLGFKNCFVAPLGTNERCLNAVESSFRNANANMTEVTFEASTKRGPKKAPRLVALAEAVQAVVHHQTTPGSCPQDKNILSNHCMPCKGLKVLFVGRIYPVKGLVNLVKAAALVKQSNNPNKRTILFRIVGPDQAGHQAELMTLAEELGVSEMFEWPGPKFGEELSAEYDNCDLLVLPSFTENFGGVVIDALAHGKPVIASKFTPWKILEDEGCGWWVWNDPESLTAAVVRAVECGSRSSFCTRDEDIGRTVPVAGAISPLMEMGRQARKLVEERYIWSAVCDKISRKYEEVLR